MREGYRHTKIIATLGPSTESEEKLRWMITGGVDVVRLNMAHAAADWTREVIRRIRRLSGEVSREVAIMMDVEEVFRQLLILWGVEPFLIEFADDPETTIENAFAYLKRRQWCSAGDNLVVITNALARDRIIDTIQLREV